jgi:hypothetical protein
MMRRISLFLISGGLMACATTAAVQPARSVKAQKQYDQLLAGKIVGKPVSCLPSFNQNEMVVIDDQTIAFRNGRNRVYVNHMQGGCSNLGGSYTLVTRQYGSSQLCRGDIGQVVDLRNHFTVGSCVFGDFVPYAKPRA